MLMHVNESLRRMWGPARGPSLRFGVGGRIANADSIPSLDGAVADVEGMRAVTTSPPRCFRCKNLDVVTSPGPNEGLKAAPDVLRRC